MAPSHLRSSDGAPPSHDRPSACCYDACCVEQRRLSTRRRILRFMASGVRSLAGTLSTPNSWLHRRGSRTRCSHTRLRWPAWRRSRSTNKVRSHTPVRAGNASQAMQATLPRSHTNVHACMHAPDTCTRPRSRTQARSFAHTHPRALGRTIAFSNLLPLTLARLNAPTHAHAHASMTKRPW
jgi:hypothetical protein